MEYALSELFTLQMGKTPSRDNSSYWKKSENNWVSIADLTNSGKYISNTKETLSDSAVAESGIKKIPANTVIMSFKLSLGKVAITEKEMYSNEAIMAFIDKGVEKISPEYLYYLLRAKDWSKGTNKAVMGATLNKATLSTIKIQLHEYDNQLEIVNMLNRVSSSIDFRKQQLTKLDELVKARFVEMFGDPVTNPFNWPAVELGQRCEIITGNTPSRAEPENYGTFIEWIKSDNINTPSTFLTPAQEYLSEVGFRKCRFVESGSLLMTCIAGSLNCIGNVAVTNRRVAFNQQINAITPTCDNVLYLYWLMILSKPAIHKTINMALKGILSKSQLSSIKFPFPSIECQNQFADFVAEVDKSKLFVELFAQSTCILAENRSK